MKNGCTAEDLYALTNDKNQNAMANAGENGLDQNGSNVVSTCTNVRCTHICTTDQFKQCKWLIMHASHKSPVSRSKHTAYTLCVYARVWTLEHYTLFTSNVNGASSFFGSSIVVSAWRARFEFQNSVYI